MTFNVATTEPQALTTRCGVGLAGMTAIIGWAALATEFHRAMTSAMADGHSLAESIFLYFRFFTILTNIGIATLMSVTVARLVTRRPLPPVGVFNGGLIYILVTCFTYEIMLRRLLAPHGLQFVTDLAIHDIVPGLMLVFWIAFAPRQGARWRDALWILVYPAAYFAMTLAAGALGEGYPYSFMDVNKLGLDTVLMVAAMFLVVFYTLGLVTTGLSMRWARRD